MEKSDIRLLVVEDEEIIRTMFRQSFEHWGFIVDEAENGKVALDRLSQNDFQIVITDLLMPVMDGMDLLKRIKSRWPHIEVVVVTGYATIENAISAMKTGAYDFILKPVNFDYVQFTINKCFQNIKAQAENTELRDLNRRLVELNEMKDKFLYITNHEIRTPLTILKGYLEILDTQLESADEETREVVGILNNTTRELTELVEKMHVLESLEAAEPSTHQELVNLRDLMLKVYKEIRGLFASRNIELKMFVDKNPLLFYADYRQLRLMFRELLQNALKYSPDGSKVIARLERKGDSIQYSVQDDGIGIPYDKQVVIFEKFYEVQDATNHKTSDSEFMGGGLGIGLSLVKEMVHAMEGEILVESEPGDGSLFKVILPAENNRRERKISNAKGVSTGS
jgi:signal transduction histidine kinase